MAGMLTTELSGYLGRAQCKFAIIQIALVPAWRVTKHITGHHGRTDGRTDNTSMEQGMRN